MKKFKEARKHFDQIRKLLSEKKSPFESMSTKEVMEKLRKTREEVWEEKLALHCSL